MSSAIFGILLLAVLLLCIKFGRVIAAVVVAFLLGVALAGGPLGKPVQALMDGIRVGVSAGADAVFSGKK